MEQSIINTLFDNACNKEPVAASRIFSALTIRKDIIAVGQNSRKTHPFQKKYGKNNDAICLHAEIDVIVKSLRKISVDDLKRASLYVVRAKKSSRKGDFVFGMAKPCSGCCRAISQFGIRNVYFTTDDGSIDEL